MSLPTAWMPKCRGGHGWPRATAVGVIFETDSKILFAVRNVDPEKGKLDFPGGFVNPHESVEQAAVRECYEELKLKVERLNYLTSFPNTYLYKNILYNTCDLFLFARLGQTHFSIDKNEIKEVRLIERRDIQAADLAFESTRKAVSYYLQNR
jgi:ADP-ribose pyrophosphatase YjhB (NUDIX family)